MKCRGMKCRQNLARLTFMKYGQTATIRTSIIHGPRLSAVFEATIQYAQVPRIILIEVCLYVKQCAKFIHDIHTYHYCDFCFTLYLVLSINSQILFLHKKSRDTKGYDWWIAFKLKPDSTACPFCAPNAPI